MPFFLRKTAKMQKKVAVTPGRKMKPGTATFYCLRFDATRIRSRISSHEDEAEQATRGTVHRDRISYPWNTSLKTVDADQNDQA